MSQAAHAFADVDSFHPDAYVDDLTVGAMFGSGVAGPVARTVAVRETVAEHFSAFEGARYRIGTVWEFGHSAFVHVDVEYRREDGSTVTVPHDNVLTYDGDVVCDWRIYLGNPR
jgi:hypothetical protein